MTTSAPTDPVDVLENALRTVLGSGFEEEVRALTESEKWYRPSLSVQELFRLWVRPRVLSGVDPNWVFHGLRMADRRRLFQAVGIAAAVVSKAGQAELAELVLESVGFPNKRSRGHRSLLDDWKELVELVDNGDDERAATLGRQRTERLLRKALFFYCSVGHAEVFARMLANPGSLRVPKAFVGASPDALASKFLDDDISDLGFLALAMRKFSTRLEDEIALLPSGSPLALLSQTEYEQVSALASALQPYTHDKPSKHDARRTDLLSAVSAVSNSVGAMIARGVVPDELVVVETGTSLIGEGFRGVGELGSELQLLASPAPPLGKRILFIASAACHHSRCVWALSPWAR